MIEAQVICDSISIYGKRLTTFKLRYPKFIHGEFMTHRVLSRNASSSRAIPTHKLIEEVRSDLHRAAPVYWGKNQKGMQAAEELEGAEREAVEGLWHAAALSAAQLAEAMDNLGVHKQIVNRLLEPFSHINVVATATEWDNFFGLRLHKDAQPEMRALAHVMWHEMAQSEPEELAPGEWHQPFVRQFKGMPADVVREDRRAINEFARENNLDTWSVGNSVSVGRCARVSYLSFKTQRQSTVAEDIELSDQLLAKQPLHASPAEHQATPDEMSDHGGGMMYHNYDQHGNFVGWRQLRKSLAGEAIAPLPEGYRP